MSISRYPPGVGLAAALCLLVSLTGQSPAAAQAAPDHGGELHLKPGDALRMVVRAEPSLSGDFPVGDDGSVLLPIGGRIAVSERSMDEVEREIRSALSAELVDPEIQMTPLIRISVLGEVRRPGLFPVDPTQTVSQVLASAGGFTPLADQDDLSLIRQTRRIELAYEPGSAALSMSLRSGDQLIVGKKSWFEEHLAIFVGAAASVASAAVTSLIVR